tara:strand:- start:12 stop:560 length:549 start_codon:yes stop_codon:yes gene_type:complete
LTTQIGFVTTVVTNPASVAANAFTLAGKPFTTLPSPPSRDAADALADARAYLVLAASYHAKYVPQLTALPTTAGVVPANNPRAPSSATILRAPRHAPAYLARRASTSSCTCRRVLSTSSGCNASALSAPAEVPLTNARQSSFEDAPVDAPVDARDAMTPRRRDAARAPRDGAPRRGAAHAEE